MVDAKVVYPKDGFYQDTGVPPLNVLATLNPEQYAFERLLREQPDEVTVAVYSDWCEQHGLDKRAAWLRAQPPAVAVTAIQRYQVNQRLGALEAIAKNSLPKLGRTLGQVLQAIAAARPTPPPDPPATPTTSEDR